MASRIVPAIGASLCLVALVIAGPAVPSDASVKAAAKPLTQAPQAWLQVSASGEFACGIPTDQSLWCWGDNRVGELGQGDVNSGQSGAQQTGPAGEWASASVGVDHACAVQTNGTLWCWGNNQYGQLGTGTVTNEYVPTQVGSASNWAAVSLGADHSCAIRSDSTLWCWGLNDHGQLGDGTLTNEDSPAQIGQGMAWAAVTAAGDHSCAVSTAGTLWCWGANAEGELGLGDKVDRKLPTQVGDQAGWASASAGPRETCALTTAHALWCWGDTNGTKPKLLPKAIGTLRKWASVAAGDEDTCATLVSGKMMCWGDNSSGQLGQGNTKASLRPELMSFRSGWSAATLGEQFVCAIRSGTQSLWCWGAGERGQLGDHSRDPRYLPTPAGLATQWATVSSSGGNQTCAILAVKHTVPGPLYCWGDNDRGQVGDGTTQSRNLPELIDSGTNWTAVTGGSSFSCGIQAGGSLWCWGDNDNGQLGVGDTVERDAPARVGAQSDWISVSAGNDHVCAVQDNGNLWCWGNGAAGDLGDGGTQDSDTPVQVTGSDWSSVSAGVDHTCALTSAGDAWCWGANGHGELGDGTTTSSDVPVAVSGSATWTQIDTGGAFTCALDDASQLWCWGENDNGQLGLGDTSDRQKPAMLTGSGWTDVSAAADHACANQVKGLSFTEWCWGRAVLGDLGDGKTSGYDDVPTQLQYQMGDPWQATYTFDDRTCAMKDFLECFGDAQGGWLGDGTATAYEAMPSLNVIVPQ